MTVGLFVFFPVVLVWVQRLVGMEVSIGGSEAIRPSYLVSLTLFALFVQYLRMLTGSIWTGVGFHLFFVYINRLLGPTPDHLIQMSEVTSEAPMQAVLGISVLLVFAGLIFYPKYGGVAIGWRE